MSWEEYILWMEKTSFKTSYVILLCLFAPISAIHCNLQWIHNGTGVFAEKNILALAYNINISITFQHVSHIPPTRLIYPRKTCLSGKKSKHVLGFFPMPRNLTNPKISYGEINSSLVYSLFCLFQQSETTAYKERPNHMLQKRSNSSPIHYLFDMHCHDELLQHESQVTWQEPWLWAANRLSVYWKYLVMQN